MEYQQNFKYQNRNEIRQIKILEYLEMTNCSSITLFNVTLEIFHILNNIFI